MRRLVLPVLAVALLAGCGSDEPTPSAGGSGQLAHLVVTVDDDGAKGSAKPRSLTLDCAEPTDSAACGAAAGVSAANLQAPAGDMACTQIYGGPDEATIKGTILGNPVDATFSRTDGCQTSRWRKVQKLLAAA